ncbi:MAG TPA: acyltransferase family protein [Acidimicrobiales bacterium]|nr:acyltransferase family protein [Acidimicrobiales bacterium]
MSHIEAAGVEKRAAARPHHPGLDGLRGVAVAAVLLFHAGFGWAVGGFLGVSAFFTLSGFLITGLLVDEHRRTGRIALGRFWSRRFRRLLPASLVTLAAVTLFGATVATADQVRALRGDIFGALGYVANWRFLLEGKSYGDLFTAPSPVQHFWSLAIEEQFYLVFPLLVAGLLAVGRGSRRLLTGALAVLAVASAVAMAVLYSPAADTARVYYGTDTRAVELLVGALLALWVGRASRAGPRRRSTTVAVAVAGTLALAASLAVWHATPQNAPWLYRGGFSLMAIVTAVVIVAATSPGPVRAALSFRPLVWLGKVSYGVYLFHWPLFLWLSPRRTNLAPAPLFALRVAVTLLVAAVSYRFIESPVRSGRRITEWRPFVLGPAAAVAVALVVVAVTAAPPPPTFDFSRASLGHLAPAPTVAAGEVARAAGDAAASDLGGATPAPAAAGVAGTPLRVMVVGDSVAHVIGAGLDRWATTTGQAVVWNVAIAGCGIARGGTVIGHLGEVRPSTPGCDAWPQRWTSQMAEFHPDVVVVLSASWDMIPRKLDGWSKFETLGNPQYDAYLVGEYEAAVDVLSAGAGRVVWINSPCAHQDSGRPTGIFDPHNVAHLDQDILPTVRAARERKVEMLDLFGRVCPKGDFTDTVGGVTDARPDGVHFTDPAADWLASWIGPVLVTSPAADPGATGAPR